MEADLDIDEKLATATSHRGDGFDTLETTPVWTSAASPRKPHDGMSACPIDRSDLSYLARFQVEPAGSANTTLRIK